VNEREGSAILGLHQGTFLLIGLRESCSRLTSSCRLVRARTPACGRAASISDKVKSDVQFRDSCAGLRGQACQLAYSLRSGIPVMCTLLGSRYGVLRAPLMQHASRCGPRAQCSHLAGTLGTNPTHGCMGCVTFGLQPERTEQDRTTIATRPSRTSGKHLAELTPTESAIVSVLLMVYLTFWLRAAGVQNVGAIQGSQ
jgi:hypothetical protein